MKSFANVSVIKGGSQQLTFFECFHLNESQVQISRDFHNYKISVNFASMRKNTILTCYVVWFAVAIFK